MTTHVVLGAGPVGSAITSQLLGHEDEVVLASRSGSGPEIPGLTRVSVDAANAGALGQVVSGASVIYNALNPSAYHAWALEWPPMWAALKNVAERTGAVLATVSNLYAYGVPDGPIREDSPVRPVEDKGRIRAQMWEDARRAHDQGRFRAVEVRASDYLGVGTESSLTRALEAGSVGRTARVLGRADLPHSWTHPDDVAALVVATAADSTAHGRVWHVPSNPARTQREVITEVCLAAGAAAPKVSETPYLAIRAIGLFDKDADAAARVAYQFQHPFVIDDTAARHRFGLLPRPWADIVAETAAALALRRAQQAGADR